jgi:hypothetical protein
MNKIETITLCGKDVNIMYCAATETGYEIVAGKSSQVFLPTVLERDENGKVTKAEPPAATLDDYIKLALAGIIAAYASEDKEPPVTDKDILYKATSEEITNLVGTIGKLRVAWYNVPDVIKPDKQQEEGGEQPKN